MHTKRVFPLALALTLAACRDEGLPDRLLQWSTGRQDVAVQEGVDVGAAINSLGVTGRFVGPSPCLSLEPELEGDRNLVLTVTGRSTGGVCPAVLGYYTYVATIGTFKPGTYHLKIQHTDSSGTRVVYDADITLP